MQQRTQTVPLMFLLTTPNPLMTPSITIKEASIDPEKETTKETPMKTGSHGSDSGRDLDTTPNTVQMSEEEVLPMPTSMILRRGSDSWSSSASRTRGTC